MFNIELKEVHIGQAIDKRREELNMSKSEFGRLIKVPQQHVNRIFERETIETAKLVKICRVLDFNFFALYCDFPENVYAFMAAVAMGNGNALNYIGDAALSSQIEKQEQKIESMEENKSTLNARIADLKDQIDSLKSQLVDKDELIRVYKNQVIK
ncbi:MAG: helix-turn-helix domain-containing protein [Muribaculaceae bacterium]|nr:helix-turn-helix domain-containing protein [Muribaculaceae bacterium]